MQIDAPLNKKPANSYELAGFVFFCFSWWLRHRILLIKQKFHQCILRMHAIFGFFPDDCIGRIEDLCRYFFTAIGGQAVHKEGIGFGEAHQLFIDLVTAEDFFALLLFIFLTHRGPGIGDNQIGTSNSLTRVIAQCDAMLIGRNEFIFRLKAFRGSDT